MLEQEDLHAVVVLSANFVNVERAVKTIAKGYHAICKKLFSTDMISKVPCQVAAEPYEDHCADIDASLPGSFTSIRNLPRVACRAEGHVRIVLSFRRVLPRVRRTVSHRVASITLL